VPGVVAAEGGIERATAPKLTLKDGNPGRSLRLKGSAGVDSSNMAANVESGRLYAGLNANQVEWSLNYFDNNLSFQTPDGKIHELTSENKPVELDLDPSIIYALYREGSKGPVIIKDEREVVEFIRVKWSYGDRQFGFSFQDRNGNEIVPADTDQASRHANDIIRNLREILNDPDFNWIQIPGDLTFEIRLLGHDYAAEHDQGTIILDVNEISADSIVHELHHLKHPDLEDHVAEGIYFLHEACVYGVEAACINAKSLGLDQLAKDLWELFAQDNNAEAILDLDEDEIAADSGARRFYELWKTALDALPNRTMRREEADFRNNGDTTRIARQTSPQSNSSQPPVNPISVAAASIGNALRGLFGQGSIQPQGSGMTVAKLDETNLVAEMDGDEMFFAGELNDDVRALLGAANDLLMRERLPTANIHFIDPGEKGYHAYRKGNAIAMSRGEIELLAKYYASDNAETSAAALNLFLLRYNHETEHTGKPVKPSLGLFAVLGGVGLVLGLCAFYFIISPLAPSGYFGPLNPKDTILDLGALAIVITGGFYAYKNGIALKAALAQEKDLRARDVAFAERTLLDGNKFKASVDSILSPNGETPAPLRALKAYMDELKALSQLSRSPTAFDLAISDLVGRDIRLAYRKGVQAQGGPDANQGTVTLQEIHGSINSPRGLGDLLVCKLTMSDENLAAMNHVFGTKVYFEYELVGTKKGHSILVGHSALGHSFYIPLNETASRIAAKYATLQVVASGKPLNLSLIWPTEISSLYIPGGSDEKLDFVIELRNPVVVAAPSGPAAEARSGGPLPVYSTDMVTPTRYVLENGKVVFDPAIASPFPKGQYAFEFPEIVQGDQGKHLFKYVIPKGFFDPFSDGQSPWDVTAQFLLESEFVRMTESEKEDFKGVMFVVCPGGIAVTDEAGRKYVTPAYSAVAEIDGKATKVIYAAPEYFYNFQTLRETVRHEQGHFRSPEGATHSAITSDAIVAAVQEALNPSGSRSLACRASLKLRRIASAFGIGKWTGNPMSQMLENLANAVIALDTDEVNADGPTILGLIEKTVTTWVETQVPSALDHALPVVAEGGRPESAVSAEEEERMFAALMAGVSLQMSGEVDNGNMTAEDALAVQGVVQRNFMSWYTDPFIDQYTREGMHAAVEQGRFKDIITSYRERVKFGTAGVRQVMALVLDELKTFAAKAFRAPILKGPGTINNLTLAMVTLGVARYYKAQAEARGEQPTVALAYDSRVQGKNLTDLVASIYLDNGFKVYMFDKTAPMPQMSFACAHLHLDIGNLVSASHNAALYNGYKVTNSSGAQLDPRSREYVLQYINGDAEAGIPAVTTRDVNKYIDQSVSLEPGESMLRKFDYAHPDNLIYLSDHDGVDAEGFTYVNFMQQHLDQIGSQFQEPLSVVQQAVSKLKVGYSAFYGAGATVFPRVMAYMGLAPENLRTVQGYNQQNGIFPRFTERSKPMIPDPGNPASWGIVVEDMINEAGGDVVKALGGLDLLEGTDPDADRAGIAIPIPAEALPEDAKDQKSQQIFYVVPPEYRAQVGYAALKLITANDSWTLLGKFIIDRMWEQGKLKTIDDKVVYNIVKTHVTTDALKKLADYAMNRYNVKIVIREPYVGFTLVAEEVEAGWREEEINLISAEESNGFSRGGARPQGDSRLGKGGHTMEKDGLLAAALVTEVAAYAKDHGKSLYQFMKEELYTNPDIGYFSTSNLPLEFENSLEGNTKKVKTIQNVLELARKVARGEEIIIDGRRVTRVTTFVPKVAKYANPAQFPAEKYADLYSTLFEEDLRVNPALLNGNFFPEEGVRFYFDDEGVNHLTIRPSGTENKLRFYVQWKAEPLSEDDTYLQKVLNADRTTNDVALAAQKMVNVDDVGTLSDMPPAPPSAPGEQGGSTSGSRIPHFRPAMKFNPGGWFGGRGTLATGEVLGLLSWVVAAHPDPLHPAAQAVQSASAISYWPVAVGALIILVGIPLAIQGVGAIKLACDARRAQRTADAQFASSAAGMQMPSETMALPRASNIVMRLLGSVYGIGKTAEAEAARRRFQVAREAVNLAA